jgi:hypothetical protein
MIFGKPMKMVEIEVQKICHRGNWVADFRLVFAIRM